MEDLGVLKNFFENKKIFITGHTGFKGAWLVIWLKRLGAEICGYSLDPPTDPSLYFLAGVGEGIASIHDDVRDFQSLNNAVREFRPDIVFHLAAQSLVLQSYETPVDTYSTNIMGTVNLLEAVRQNKGIRAVVNITSDKCYDNREWIWGYRENDPMGGLDPYASSKGCAELVSAAYLHSYFHSRDYESHGVALATARAGNVIGSGDFARDRLIPDMVKSFIAKKTVCIRSPHAIRPWQHVLEPLSGYLLLAKNLYENGPQFDGAWNFGPDENAVCRVQQIVHRFAEVWGDDASWRIEENGKRHEAKLLKLDSSKARLHLNWKPRLTIDHALKWTVDGYKIYRDAPERMRQTCERQIEQYESLRPES